VKSDESRLKEMLRHSDGARKVPVVVEGDKVTVGYGGY
jgi:glutaredoxin